MHQYATLEDTVYFGFAANLTSGAAGDGATPLYDVRLAGAAAGAAPVLSGTPTLLTHANYGDGLHEVAIAATAANGFAAGSVYLVFVTLTISSVTPGAFVGSFSLFPVISNLKQVNAAAQTATLDTIKADTAAVKTKTDFLPSITAGSAGGVFIAGSNAATSITTALTANVVGNVTGNLSGSVGSVTGLTASNLDATISSRMASYTQPTGFLAATFPTGTVANTTNITAAVGVTAATVSDKTGYALSATGSAALTEGYAADGDAPTLNQMLYQLLSALTEFSISGTTITCKKLDGSTSAMTFTLDDATNPTSRTRAS